MSDYNLSDLNAIEYVTSDGVHHVLLPVSQRIATEATTEDIEKDELGITDPNLHRRIDNEAESDYSLGVKTLHSYRTRIGKEHDEDSETCEIP